MKIDDAPEREEQALTRLRETLVVSYAGRVAPEEIELAIEKAAEMFAAVPIRDFVPLLVERHVRDVLRRRAGASGGDGTERG